MYEGRDEVYGVRVLDPERSDVYLDGFSAGMSGLPLKVHRLYNAFLELPNLAHMSCR